MTNMKEIMGGIVSRHVAKGVTKDHEIHVIKNNRHRFTAGCVDVDQLATADDKDAAINRMRHYLAALPSGSDDGVDVSDVCAECGGECCTRSPGLLWPSDLGTNVTMDAVTDLLLTGMYAVDYWEGGLMDGHKGYQGLFLRPRTIDDHPAQLIYGSWGGRCVFLTEGGCALPFNLRPRTCRLVIPKSSPDGKCTYPDGRSAREWKLSAIYAWLPYETTIEAAIEAAKRTISEEKTLCVNAS